MYSYSEYKNMSIYQLLRVQVHKHNSYSRYKYMRIPVYVAGMLIHLCNMHSYICTYPLNLCNAHTERLTISPMRMTPARSVITALISSSSNPTLNILFITDSNAILKELIKEE